MASEYQAHGACVGGGVSAYKETVSSVVLHLCGCGPPGHPGGVNASVSVLTTELGGSV